MQRYESGSPRALFGIFAVAMTAATLALSVLAPAAAQYSARDIGVLAASGGDLATYDATPITSIDVVAVRPVRHVPVVEARRAHHDANLQG
jgi:hypothetical protein